MYNNKWDKRFLDLADYISSWSKDPSTKCGAVIVRGDRTIASVGYNGFPKWTSDRMDLYYNREAKLDRMIHAELNAILNAGSSVGGYSLYSTLAPCSQCAGAIIQAEICEVIAPISFPSRWANSIATGLEMLEEVDIEVRLIG